MKKLCMAITIILAASLLATACTQEKQKPANIAALVNGEPITIEDLHSWIEQREIVLEVQKRFSQQDSENHIEIPEELSTDFEQFLIDMNVTSADLSEDQETFLKSHYIFFRGVRGSTASLTVDDFHYLKHSYSQFVFTPDESQALCHQIRNLVLYQEAVKQGHQVPEAEAREMYKSVTGLPQLSQEREPELEELLRIEAEVLQEYGYQSREAYLEQQFPDYVQVHPVCKLPILLQHQKQFPDFVQSISISNLKYSFLEQWMVQYPNLHGYEYHVKSENAWYDYTESLVRQADIEVHLIGFKGVTPYVYR